MFLEEQSCVVKIQMLQSLFNRPSLHERDIKMIKRIHGRGTSMKKLTNVQFIVCQKFCHSHYQLYAEASCINEISMLWSVEDSQFRECSL